MLLAPNATIRHYIVRLAQISVMTALLRNYLMMLKSKALAEARHLPYREYLVSGCRYSQIKLNVKSNYVLKSVSEVPSKSRSAERIALAENDGMRYKDLMSWLQKPFTGQVICWSEDVSYGCRISQN